MKHRLLSKVLIAASMACACGSDDEDKSPSQGGGTFEVGGDLGRDLELNHGAVVRAASNGGLSSGIHAVDGHAHRVRPLGRRYGPGDLRDNRVTHTGHLHHGVTTRLRDYVTAAH